jgi:3-phenylpropionate/cinnamic acid dioxygenase small subunit
MLMAGTQEDWLEITALVNRYAHAVDGRNWAMYESCFTTDAEIDYSSAGGSRGGVAQSMAWLATMLEPFSVSQHFITNQVIGLEGDDATCRAYFFGVVGNQSEADSGLIWVGGIYEDRLRRTDAGWRIAELIDVGLWTSPGPVAG